MAKSLIRCEGSHVSRLYIDEIGRASRDAIEALKLGKLIDACRKRLIGVSDGFDSQATHSKLMLHMFAMLHEWFVDQLQCKVRRGMADAFGQGRNIFAAAFGYRLVPTTDDVGDPIIDSNGKQLMKRIIDDDTAVWVRKAFELLIERLWSPEQIARYFAENNVGGSSAWCRGRIVQLLKRELYVGFEFYGKTFQVHDSETGKKTVKHRPRHEWKRREVPHLRIISDESWQKKEDRLKELSSAFRRGNSNQPNRTTVYPKKLFRPVCAHCGKELRLGRAGKYASYCCDNGAHRKHGCPLTTYKAVNIVESGLLGVIQEKVFTDEFLRSLITRANRFLILEAKKPKADVGPLKKSLQKLTAKRDRLMKLIERDTEGNLEALAALVGQLERQVREKRKQLEAMQKLSGSPPRPMCLENVSALLQDLRGLLQEEVSVAAPILREMTGPIRVRQGTRTSRKGTAWIAEFQVNMVPVLAHLSAKRDCPTTDMWEYLSSRKWTIPEKVEVKIDHIPQYEAYADEAIRLHHKGNSIKTIAAALRTDWRTVVEAIRFGTTGERPKKRVPSTMSRKPLRRLTAAETEEVARLRDEQNWSFKQIAKKLNCTPTTAAIAYDRTHREQLHESVEQGRTPQRGRFSPLGPKVFHKIRAGIQAGWSTPRIAKFAGCGLSTVRRERARLNTNCESSKGRVD